MLYNKFQKNLTKSEVARMVDESEKICYEILKIIKDCQIEILKKLKKEKK